MGAGAKSSLRVWVRAGCLWGEDGVGGGRLRDSVRWGGYRHSERLRNFFRVKYHKFLEVCFLNRTNKQETNPARVGSGHSVIIEGSAGGRQDIQN